MGLCLWSIRLVGGDRSRDPIPTSNYAGASDIQIVRRHEELKTQLGWKTKTCQLRGSSGQVMSILRVGHILSVLVLLIVIEVLADLLQYYAAVAMSVVINRCVPEVKTHLMLSNRTVLVLASRNPSSQRSVRIVKVPLSQLTYLLDRACA